MSGAAMRSKNKAKPTFWKGVLWMVVIWSLSVMALGLVSMLFRLLMQAAGMKSH